MHSTTCTLYSIYVYEIHKHLDVCANISQKHAFPLFAREEGTCIEGQIKITFLPLGTFLVRHFHSA